MSLLTTLAAVAALAVTPLPTGTDVDYQLGGDRPVPAHVGIVARDRESAPIDGKYNVCYVNGFQTQSNERKFWKKHWNLVLKKNGKAVEDSAWGEWLLDVRTASKRERLARIVGRWTDGCADDGYDAVEFDNLDSFTRSHHLITKKEAVAYAGLLVDAAHDAGLAAGQKNLAGFDGTSIGYDFAVAEECGRYRECASYTKFYGDRVLAIEYRRQDFRWTCQHVGDDLPVVLRDRNLTTHGVRKWC
ncbi:endo alpha-1,4 polygalactosaminidase [Nocardioides mangrovi]|uniref:Endo alpha-1,4 polygalactosaminidase n=1 Tax=Nocardioides mangrovi TaxID=2874580 RepID=A0ABS7U709_9ACTN|nr:endo alpha-1,4 polygalactosaminidase [Nocardioides mangrovi]MBZ5736625.1 endo alpha-1,4 polygalactosaminidase [Nocardioides mangrovi]